MALPTIQRQHFPPAARPPSQPHRYLEKLLCGSPSICTPVFKNITPITLEISPKLAREQGRRSMLFNIKLFTKMTFIMLMAKSP